MPLSFTPIQEHDCWHGSTWTVEDEDKLAEMIARVALGQSRSVERILSGKDKSSESQTGSGFTGAKELLSVENGAKTYHRDGWVFQVISWIAAHLQRKGALIRAPQMLKADKGLDGIIVEFDDGSIARVVICEDKATENPRDTVRNHVWPEFQDFETGARDNELVASVTALLERSGDAQPDKTVTDILWEDTRSYRIAVTVTEQHSEADGRKKLFKGYEKKVPGDIPRRCAETLHKNNIREWIKSIAKKAESVVDTLEKKASV